MHARPTLAIACVLSLSLSGCTGIFTAHIPDSLLINGWQENTSKRTEEKRNAGFTLNRVTLFYEFTDPEDQGAYPAELILTTARILGGASNEELIDALDKTLQKVLADEGVSLDPNTRVDGKRTLGQGQNTLFFTYEAEAEANGFFAADHEIRILGEVFNDGTSDVNVILIGLAQTTGGLSISPTRDESQWHRIIGDPDGTIEGVARSDGLAYNVVSHD